MGEIVANGVRIGYEEFGEGEPVVLICGTSMPPVVWQMSLVPALVGAGYRVVTFANRGTEPSDAPPAPYTVGDMTADVSGLIDALNLAPCRVVGYSLGGFIAEELSYARPELVREVVLMASAGPASAFVRAWNAAEVEVATATDLSLRDRAARDLLFMLLPVALLQNDDATVDAFRAMFSAGEPWPNPGRLGQWTADLEWGDNESRTERWSHLHQRCLVLAFEQDILWPPRAAREAVAVMPNATYAEIAGAAHGGPLTHAEDVSRAVVSFFAAE